jgi:hypothetical protein
MYEDINSLKGQLDFNFDHLKEFVFNIWNEAKKDLKNLFNKEFLCN